MPRIHAPSIIAPWQGRAGRARIPGSPCDMTETVERHDPGGTIKRSSWTATTSWARGRTAGGVTEPGPLEGSSPRSFRWPSATEAYGRLCSMGRSRPACCRRPSASSWFTLGMAAGMELMIESWNLCTNARIGPTSLVYTSDAKLRTRVKALGTQVMGSGVLLSQIATLRATHGAN